MNKKFWKGGLTVRKKKGNCFRRMDQSFKPGRFISLDCEIQSLRLELATAKSDLGKKNFKKVLKC